MLFAKRPKLFEEDKDYITESHISAFAKALIWDNHSMIDTLPSTPNITGSPGSSSMYSAKSEFDNDIEELLLDKKPDLITSKNDWFPVNQESKENKAATIKKPRAKKEAITSTISMLTNEFRNSSSYMLLRWPILILVFGWIGILGLLYFLVRIYVALSEYLFTWTGERKRLRDKLRGSKTYDEWVTNAINLDKYLNLDQWSINPKFSYYDYKTVKLTIHRLKSFRNQDKDYDLMVLLQACLKRNFAGIENRQLYSHRYYGTKNLVHQYYEEVVKSITKIIDSTKIDPLKKKKFFKIVDKNYGKTALCLSGGACFAYTHFGLAKALIDVDLLPKIISGTSGGGLIAALLCTRTNEELKQLLVPELARKITACEDPWYIWIPRFWRTGARFDSISWARKSNFFTRGSTTFEEAYARTGRKLNISTVPADPHSPVILCNDTTSPHCIIWSTLLASSAVPGILNPVVLMMKNPSTEQVEPFSLGSKWRDGSLRTDIPIDALNTYYNVNFTVVSQVNPHISLFFFAPKGTVGRPVSSPTRKTKREKYASLRGGFIATALEQLFRLEIKKWLQIIKSLDLLPNLMSQDWSNIWLQNFTGSITIWPRNRLKDFWYILSDPTEAQFKEILLKGERSMFPRILFVKHRMSIERVIERGKKVTSTQSKLIRAQLGEVSDEHGTSSGSDYDYPSFRNVIDGDDVDVLQELEEEDEEDELDDVGYEDMDEVEEMRQRRFST
ncbi:Patatin-like phospholipase domain-containing protein [Spathaspora sp. JA1]|nr:Patatin-like phospholipase domain-containing protein [Spathaspora sp. JA1]